VWEHADNCTIKGKLEGLAFSILNIFDGTTGLPAMDIVLSPHPEDKDFALSEGERWYEEGMIINDCYLHELFYGEKPQ
jgi:hypothetical protein